MRSDRSAQDDKLFLAQGAARWLRVDVQDSGGTWRDLTAQRNYNFVEHATWKTDHDTKTATGSVELTREIFKWSLAPEIAASYLNTLGGGTQLLFPNRRVRIYTQLQPTGIAAQSSAWTLVFDGVIVDTKAEKDPIVVEIADLTKRLEDAFIQNERAYGVWQPGQRYIADATLGAVVAPPPNDPTYPNPDPNAPTGPWFRATSGTGTAAANNWIASHSYTNATVTPTIPNGFTYTMSGTASTGATEPTWPLTPGATVVDSGVTWTCVQPTPPVWPNTLNATVTDNGITWTCVQTAGGSPTATPLETQIQMVLDDNTGVGTWSLYTPSATGEVVRPYTQSGENVLEAITKLADIIAWDIRYKYDTGTSQFRLTLYDVNRTNTTSAYTIPASVYAPIEQWERSAGDVRNQIAVFYWDGVTVDSQGTPILSRVLVPDATTNSQDSTLYSLAIASQNTTSGLGVRYAAVTEGAGAIIGSATAARKMAQGILSDWCAAPLNVGLQLDMAWWFEVADMVTVGKDNLHADSDSLLAIWSVECRVNASGESVTRLGLRGRPSTGGDRHAQNLALHGVNKGPVRQLGIIGTEKPTASATIAGASLKWRIPTHKRYDSTEIHMSTASASFVPSSNTFVKSTRTGGHDVAPGANGSAQTGTIAAGTTYYVKTIHKSRSEHSNELLASPPSPAVTVTTGYANLAHINPNLRQNARYVFANRLNGFQVAASGDTVLTFDQIDYDPQSIYNGATGVFTFLYTGEVTIHASLMCDASFSGATGPDAGDAATLVLQKLVGPTWTDEYVGNYGAAIGVSTGVVLPVEIRRTIPTALNDQWRVVFRPTAFTAGPWKAYTITGSGIQSRSGFVQTTQEFA